MRTRTLTQSLTDQLSQAARWNAREGSPRSQAYLLGVQTTIAGLNASGLVSDSEWTTIANTAEESTTKHRVY